MTSIKEARKEAGLTQAQIAKKIGIDRTVYTKIENGTYAHTISLGTADKLAHALGLNIYEIFPAMLESEAEYIRALTDEREDAYNHISSAFMRTASALCNDE